MHSFSSKHKLHIFDPPEYELACFMIDHVMVKSSFFSLSFQMCFESSVCLLLKWGCSHANVMHGVRVVCCESCLVAAEQASLKRASERSSFLICAIGSKK